MGSRRLSSAKGLHAIAAEIVGSRHALAHSLDEEAALADELAVGLGLHPTGGLAGVVLLLLLVLLVLEVVGRGDPVLQDGVEVGLYVVGIELVLVVVLLSRLLALGRGGRHVGLGEAPLLGLLDPLLVETLV